MKKYLAMLLAVLMAAALLAGCVTADPEPTPTTEPTTAPTTEPTTESTTEPTTEPITEPTEPPTEPPTELATEEEKFQELLSYDHGYWYWRAMGCIFENPEDISLRHFLYNGLKYEERQDTATYTDSEVAFLKALALDTWGDEAPWVNANKMPRQYINDVLEAYLGITLDDVTIPEAWTYFEETDAYYYIRSDGYGVSGHTVKEVTVLEDGTIQVCWTAPLLTNTLTGEYMEHPEMVMTLREQEDGGYLILSNTLAD